MAAARLSILSPAGLLAWLDDRFAILTSGSRSALPRQQTLLATMDWSYELLNSAEQAFLRRLSVFAGGWTLEAAEAVCAAPALDPLTYLVSKSLVVVGEDGEETRYSLLETIRQYAWQKLVGAGEAAEVRERHLAWCIGLAEGAESGRRGPEHATWLGRLEAEHANLRAALRWAIGAGQEPVDHTARGGAPVQAEAGLQLAGALWRFWYTRGYLAEGRGWLEAALAGAGGSAAARATALHGAGVLAYQQGEYGPAVASFEGALALRRALGDTQGIAAALGNLGNVAYMQGHYPRAAALHEEGLALYRALGDQTGIAATLVNLGRVAYQQGEYGQAVTSFEGALVLWRALGDGQGVSAAINNLGEAAMRQGDYPRAAALYEESLALKRTLGYRQGISTSLGNLGRVAERLGDYGRAAALLEESLTLKREVGDQQGIADELMSLGRVAHRQGDDARADRLLTESLRLSRALGARDLMAEGLLNLCRVAGARGQAERAARLGGAAQAAREALGLPLEPYEQAGQEQAMAALRAALGEERFAVAWAEGQALSVEQALAEALRSPVEPMA
jgi:tetratricopeptide (TPR) repeat protein